MSGHLEENSFLEIEGTFQKRKLAYGFLPRLQTRLRASAGGVARKSSSGTAWGFEVRGGDGEE